MGDLGLTYQERYCSPRGLAARLSQLKSKKQSARTKPSGSVKAQLEKPNSSASLMSRILRRPFSQIGFALLGLSLLLLMGVEMALRLVGYGYSTRFFRPTGIGGRPVLVENDDFNRSFFSSALDRNPVPVVVNRDKATNAFRIFLFGDSAALGDPDPAYGPGRYLEALLSERFPDVRFEVICVASRALNSHAALRIADECSAKKGDIWVVYLGNNEMSGPFGAMAVRGPQAPSLTNVQLRLGLQRLRLAQLLFTKDTPAPADSASVPEAASLTRVPPNDPRRGVVFDNFQKNLQEIIDAGHRAGSKVLLNTVAINLKDCSPLASLDLGELPPEERMKVDSSLKAGSEAETQRDFAVAAVQYDHAVKAFPQSADAQFRLAACLLKVTNYSTAREHFESAVDCDTRPLRAVGQINRIISEMGRRYSSQDVVLIDAFSLFNTNSPAGIAGRELFLDHDNFNFDGNYLLARAWAEAITPALPPIFTNHSTAEWPAQAVCEQQLGLTDWNRAAVLDKALAALSDASFAGQFNYSQRVSWLGGQIAAAKTRLHPREFIDARFNFEQAIKKSPEDHWLHQKFAEFLEVNNDLPGATTEWEKVRNLLPFLYSPYYQIGRLLAAQGKAEEAQSALLRAVALRPDFVEAWIGLGKVSLAQKRFDVALNRFERAKEVSPGNFWAYYHMGKALTALDRNGEAILNLRQAIALGPRTFVEARLALGEALVLEGKTEQAANEFSQVIRLKPDLAVAHFNLGLALLKLGQTERATAEFQEVLHLEPQNESMKEAISKILGAQP